MEAGMTERAATNSEEGVLIDAMGSGVLLPTALIPPPSRNGAPLIDRAITAGLTAMNVTMGITGIGMGVDDLHAMLGTMQGYFSLFEMDDRLVHVLTAADIHRARRECKLGIIFGCQGIAGKIGNDPGLLTILQRLGQRIVQLTYNERSAVGCGCLEIGDAGLTQFGRVCIRELNHLGVVVDLAHGGMRTALDAIGFSAAPPIISHANVRALCDSPRNLTDDVIRATAAAGGVIGVTAYAPFCEVRPGVRPDIDAYIDHIAYIADLVGIGHVGIGSDFFDGESLIRFEGHFRRRNPEVVRDYTIDTVYAEGLGTVDDFPRLIAALHRRGFSPPEVAQVSGGNFLRVFDAVWGG
jgi:membrane dipeptidase